MGVRRGIQKVLVGKSEGKRMFGRPRHKWKDGIKMALQEVGLGVAQDWDRWQADVNTVMNIWDP